MTSKSNPYRGGYLTGTGITVRNAKFKNSESGLVIGSNFISWANNVTLAGDISITNNGVGLTTNTFPNQRTVRVTGDLNILRNDVGIELKKFSNLNLVVGAGSNSTGKSGKSGSGSLTACDNSVHDIANIGESTFEGSDYVCDTRFNDSTEADLPDCKPCYPHCPSS